MGLYTSKQVAEMTGFTHVYINRLCQTKRILARKFGRDWLINDNGLDQIKNLTDLRTREARSKKYAK